MQTCRLSATIKDRSDCKLLVSKQVPEFCIVVEKSKRKTNASAAKNYRATDSTKAITLPVGNYVQNAPKHINSTSFTTDFSLNRQHQTTRHDLVHHQDHLHFHDPHAHFWR